MKRRVMLEGKMSSWSIMESCSSLGRVRRCDGDGIVGFPRGVAGLGLEGIFLKVRTCDSSALINRQSLRMC